LDAGSRKNEVRHSVFQNYHSSVSRVKKMKVTAVNKMKTTVSITA